MTESRKVLAGALTALICLFSLAGTVEAAARAKRPATSNVQRGQWDRKPGDHTKLDRKLNDRSSTLGTSRVIVTLKPGVELGSVELLAKYAAKRGRKLSIISGQVVELPNAMIRRLADHKNVLSIVHDRRTGGSLNRSTIASGAQAVQQDLGYDGAGVGVAVIDSGVTAWHDDLTYQGNNPAVRVNAGQRTVKFVDFVNGYTNPYDDNGHGSHVSGIILGSGYDTLGARAGIAPAAHLVSLKVLDDHGGGYISNVIAALEWAVVNKAAYNIRVINLSVGAAVSESYETDPLCLAAKQAVDAGIVVVTAAGNLGKNPVTGAAQWGGVTAPGNAPWVLTVGAYSHEGTLTRTDDKLSGYSSRGPTAIDLQAKPDVSAMGTGIVSLSSQGSTFYATKGAYLLDGSIPTSYKPYLSLTGTSMAAPAVAGTVALMIQANPGLTPNLAKAVIQYTAERRSSDTALAQGAGFLNAKGAVDLAKFLGSPQVGQAYPSHAKWGKAIHWGNRKVTNGVPTPGGSAWALNIVWGTVQDLEGENIVWGTRCGQHDPECDNIVWGTSQLDADNIVWGTADGETDNIVWGTACGDNECDNIVWGTSQLDADNIVWGTTPCGGDAECDNIVWGTTPCGDAECDNIVWGTAASMEADNIVWGTGGAMEADNIVWGTGGVADNPFVTTPFATVEFDSLFDPPQTTDPSLPPPPVAPPTSDSPSPVGTEPPPTVVPPPADPMVPPTADPMMPPPADPMMPPPVDPTMPPPADPTMPPPADPTMPPPADPTMPPPADPMMPPPVDPMMPPPADPMVPPPTGPTIPPPTVPVPTIPGGGGF